VEIKAKAEKAKQALLRPWILYSFGHTFLTRLGESGCDAWMLARIAGHVSIAISSRYVHPSEDAVLNAMAKLGRQKLGTMRKRRKLLLPWNRRNLRRTKKVAGAPGEIRTPDLLLRRQSLYPTELRARTS